jgi:hypothetical protein
MKIKLLSLVVSFFVSSTGLFATSLTLSSNMPVNAIQNLIYTGLYTASGGTGSYTFSVSSGLLPAGLSLNTATGQVSGSPTFNDFKPYAFTVTVTDSGGATASQAMIIYLAPSAGSNFIKYPSDSLVIDVKAQYGAVGNGLHDDTNAIQSAISAVAAGGLPTADTIIYFPAGTYLVSGPLVWGSLSGTTWNWASYITLAGHWKTDTIIKLADGTPGFRTGDANPLIPGTSSSLPSKAVFFTAPNNGTQTGNPGATGNTGFRNHIMNLTIDVGTGNTAAIAIDYLGSNNCRLSDINIISDDGNGDTGLSMQRQWQGPDLIKNVTIAGFTKGIAMGSGYANWLEHIVLNRQTTAGIYFASGDVATIRDLKSNNSVPAVTNTSNGVSLSIIDSNLKGGTSGNYAVNNVASAPRVFIRNTSQSGYAGLASGGTTQSCGGGSWTEWTSNPALSAITTSPTSACSLNLAVNETPLLSSDDFTASSAVSILSLSPTIVVNDNTVDNSTLISSAINNTTSSATTIYFPYGTYYIGNPIQINIPATGNVKRLVFFGSKLSPRIATHGGFSGSQAIDIKKTLGAGLFLQNLLLVKNGAGASFPQPSILQEATATAQVVILNSEDISYTSNSGAGTLYLESVNYGPFVFNGQTVYARHLNPELSQTHVTATGGSVWVLGLKTENRDTPTGSTQPAIPIANVSGTGNFEVLGASIYGANTYDTSAAMFTLSNSSVSVSSMTTGAASGLDYYEWISETRNGTSGIVCANGYTLSPCSSSVPHSYSRPSGSVIPLYIGH